MKTRSLLLGSGAVIVLVGTLTAACGYANACKKKTTGYFQQLGEAVATSATTGLSGIGQSLSGISGDAARGRLVVINRKKGNCLACHKVSSISDQPFHGELGPSLDSVSVRYQDKQLRQMVVDARSFFPNTIMPAFYVNTGYTRVSSKFADKTILTAQEVEDVVAFLKTLK